VLTKNKLELEPFCCTGSSFADFHLFRDFICFFVNFVLFHRGG